ncbi:MAG: COX15/CtaA family protein [Gemmatimonadaceae bacterium]
MNHDPSIRRLSYLALAIAYVQIVFGAIVRISNSGLGCGDHWPKCAGYWFPPLDRTDLLIELTHRYLALLVTVAIIALLVSAWRRRGEPVANRVLRPAAVAAGLVVTAAIFGAITVKMTLEPIVIVVHLAIAMTLLATLALATVRAGGLGASRVAAAPTAKSFRGARVAAGMAFVILVLGALTANLPGANVACMGFPLCNELMAKGGMGHLQLTHRVLAYLLALHVIGLAIGVAKRRERGAVLAASRVALAAVVVQIAIAAAMVLGHLPPALRSAHQAAGALVWLSLFTLAALARLSAVREFTGATTSEVSVPFLRPSGPKGARS